MDILKKDPSLYRLVCYVSICTTSSCLHHFFFPHMFRESFSLDWNSFLWGKKHWNLGIFHVFIVTSWVIVRFCTLKSECTKWIWNCKHKHFLLISCQAQQALALYQAGQSSLEILDLHLVYMQKAACHEIIGLFYSFLFSLLWIILQVCTELLLFSHQENKWLLVICYICIYWWSYLDFKSDKIKTSLIYFCFRSCKVSYRDIDQMSKRVIIQKSSFSFISFSLPRDIAKNSLLQWPIFIYWTILGVYDAIVMFFGAYFLFDNTTFTSNGQVMTVIPYAGIR